MLATAEELLRQKTVPELRQLILTIDKDASLKTSELQQMVGSKYQDFIRSADTIAEMNNVSVKISNQMDNFWISKCLPVIENSKHMLELCNDEDAKQSHQLTKGEVGKVDSASVWQYLDNEEIGSAGQVILKAELYLATIEAHCLEKDQQSYNTSSVFSCKSSNSSKISVESTSEVVRRLLLAGNQYLTSHTSNNNTPTSGNSSNGSVDLNTCHDCKTAAFLKETVISDAKLLLVSTFFQHEVANSFNNKANNSAALPAVLRRKAEILATVSLLTGSDDIGSLSLYLDAASVIWQNIFKVLEEACKKYYAVVGNKESKSQGNTEDADGTNKATATQLLHSITGLLSELISCLQCVTMDVFYLFLDTKPRAGSSMDKTNATPVTGEHVTAVDELYHLIERYKMDLLKDVCSSYYFRCLHEKCSALNRPGAVSSGGARQKREAPTTIINHLVLSVMKPSSRPADTPHADISAGIVTAFQTWLNDAVSLTSSTFHQILTNMLHTGDVSLIEAKLYERCAKYEPLTLPSSIASGLYLQEIVVASVGTSSCYADYCSGHWELVASLLTLSGSGSGSSFTASLSSSTSNSANPQIAFDKMLMKELMDSGEMTADETVRNVLSTSVNGASRVSGSGHTTVVLWSSIFHMPLVQQADRLLQASAQDVVCNFSDSLVDCLLQIGLRVNPTHTPVSSVTSLPASLQKSRFIGFSYVQGTRDAAHPKGVSTHSKDVYVHAHCFVEQVEQAIEHFAEELVSSKKDVGSQSNQSLVQSSYSISHYCIQLFSQYSSILRNVSESLAHTASSLQAAIKGNDVGDSRKQEKRTRVLNDAVWAAQLFIGRVAWLLCSQEHSCIHKIWEHYVSSAAHPKLVTSTPDASYYGAITCTENQLRSAFEIADTDGDGLVSLEEALEAVYALCIEDEDLSAQNVHSHKNGKYKIILDICGQRVTNISGSETAFGSLLVSLSFVEFSLLCSYLQDSEESLFRGSGERQREVLYGHYAGLMKELVVMSHGYWLRYISCPSSPVCDNSDDSNATDHMLTNQLLREYGLAVCDTSGSSHGTRQHMVFDAFRQGMFRSQWRQPPPRGDSDVLDAADADEAAALPACPCMISQPLYMYFCGIAIQYTDALVSVDTLLLIEKPELCKDKELERKEFNFLSVTSNTLVQNILDYVVEVYSELWELIDSNSAESEKRGLSASCVEDIAMQCIFDLLFIVHWCDQRRFKGEFTDLVEKLKRFVDQWRQHVDLITMTLIDDVIHGFMIDYYNSVLVYLPAKASSKSAGDRKSAGHTTAGVSLSGIFSSSASNSNSARDAAAGGSDPSALCTPVTKFGLLPLSFAMVVPTNTDRTSTSHTATSRLKHSTSRTSLNASPKLGAHSDSGSNLVSKALVDESPGPTFGGGRGYSKRKRRRRGN